MPANIDIGPRIGIGEGPRIGVGSDPMGGVSRDATSLKYVPNTAAEWHTTMGAAGLANRDPAYLWRCQETSGNLADSIGAITLTAANSPGYDAAVSGWSRKAVTWSDATSQKFTNFTDVPNLNANSFALLGYFFTSNTPAAEREVAGIGNATVAQIRATTGQKYKIIGPSGVNATGTVNYGAGVRPLMVVYRQDGLFPLKLYTDAEIIDPSNANGITGGGVWLGGQTTMAPTGGCLYAAAWIGTVSIAFSDDEVRALLRTLGWTVGW